jgi:hypothetical protein
MAFFVAFAIIGLPECFVQLQVLGDKISTLRVIERILVASKQGHGELILMGHHRKESKSEAYKHEALSQS